MDEDGRNEVLIHLQILLFRLVVVLGVRVGVEVVSLVVVSLVFPSGNGIGVSDTELLVVISTSEITANG